MMLLMPLFMLIALGVVIALAVYAWRLTRRVAEQDVARSQAIEDSRQSVQILIGSYLQQQVDRSECLLRTRVLLDASFADWRDATSGHAFETVSNALLAMPFGQARAKLDTSQRQDQDATRRQLLQLHEKDLEDELKQLQEWISK